MRHDKTLPCFDIKYSRLIRNLEVIYLSKYIFLWKLVCLGEDPHEYTDVF